MMTPFIGVRSSWLMFARNRLFASLAASAVRSLPSSCRALQRELQHSDDVARQNGDARRAVPGVSTRGRVSNTAQRTERLLVWRHQRGAGVEAEPARSRHERVARKARVGAEVFHHERPVLPHGPFADADLARDRVDLHAGLRREHGTRGIDERDPGGGSLADRRDQLHDLVERHAASAFAWAIALDRVEARRFVAHSCSSYWASSRSSSRSFFVRQSAAP